MAPTACSNQANGANGILCWLAAGSTKLGDQLVDLAEAGGAVNARRTGA